MKSETNFYSKDISAIDVRTSSNGAMLKSLELLNTEYERIRREIRAIDRQIVDDAWENPEGRTLEDLEMRKNILYAHARGVAAAIDNHHRMLGKWLATTVFETLSSSPTGTRADAMKALMEVE